MKRLVFHLRNALEPARVDRVVVDEGAVLRALDATNAAFVPVSQVVGVALEDGEAAAGGEGEGVPPGPEERRSPVSSHGSTGTPASRWGALPLGEEPPDA